MSANKATIFVLEDEKIISHLIKTQLENEVKEVRVYSNGIEGFEAIKKHKPDLIILDLMLPGMEGFEILKKIKSNDSLSQINVLILSAKARDDDIKRGFNLGADEYMEKPFKMNELVLRLKNLIG